MFGACRDYRNRAKSHVIEKLRARMISGFRETNRLGRVRRYFSEKCEIAIIRYRLFYKTYTLCFHYSKMKEA